ncbi:AAA family ATPase [Sphingomonas glacialis]|uniref:non-specific protein-tyrosine kinase n=1 Tax=Sphingomonas glacialis TaxID=658225 RepID=A0A502FI66_9SPHN|nr:AAA family ATPase [Sphingomonas glacialis]TPG49084.1 exopolysaccharide biosynthesis protein [Sphingomonas glacialis]
MSDPTPRKRPSLLEQAASRYDFNDRIRPLDDVPEEATAEAPTAAPVASPKPEARPVAKPRTVPRPGSEVKIDRALLAERGMLVPGAPIGALVEEFRLVKRQLLTTARGVRVRAGDLSRTILVTSAQPDDGKTYCALNLAISMAAERDLEILLIDADFAKPDVMARLGLSEGRGLLDALADPQVELESCIVRTDIQHLSLLPCGTKSNADTELVASARTGELIAELLAADPRRVLIFDSPPVLAASPAAALAHHAGQVMLVVRADRTGDGELREAVDLLDGCEDIQLLLNAVSFAPGGRRFGSYYGQQEDAS